MSDDIKQTQKVNVTYHMAIQRGNNIEAAALYLIYGVGDFLIVTCREGEPGVSDQKTE